MKAEKIAIENTESLQICAMAVFGLHSYFIHLKLSPEIK